jgi:hypothetical protein
MSEMPETVYITVTVTPQGEDALLDCTECGPLMVIPKDEVARSVAGHLVGHNCDMDRVVATRPEEDEPL